MSTTEKISGKKDYLQTVGNVRQITHTLRSVFSFLLFGLMGFSVSASTAGESLSFGYLKEPNKSLLAADTLIHGFINAASIDITPLGSVFITDSGADIICTFSTGEMDQHVQRGEWFEVSMSGQIQVHVSTGNNEPSRFTEQESLESYRQLEAYHQRPPVHIFGSTGSGEAQFRNPAQTDATNGLKIYVADAGNHRIQIFDRNLQRISVFESLQSSPYASQQYGLTDRDRITPTKLHVAQNGQIYVYDSNAHTVRQIEPNGQLLAEIDLSIVQIKHVSSITSTREMLWIYDRTEQLIHRFYLDGMVDGFLKLDQQVMAIREYEDQLYELSSNGIRVIDVRPSALSKSGIQFDAPLPDVRDFDIHGGYLYLLTNHTLLRLPYDG